ncbi:glyoxalase [Kitasatospora sp. MMS16-BH015]|uniref:VOC family protein n=1 Tax=Kitasatospora sp. MMS16-BH015 TaxID=2018025 RepID=UPI000CA2450A|nr:VOC family protein [Kitasatospora sp. MMS16-BH015]AUG78612.1 glyoxalase [Kitasatospora sp. MMS16-BH015]
MSSLQTGHIGINVTDLARSTAFYEQALGLETTYKAEDHAFLGTGDRTLVTLWQQSTDTFATDRPGLHHLSFQLDTLAEVLATEATLKSLGTHFTHEGVVPHHEGSASGGIFFTDPDGTRLEIYTAQAMTEAVAAPSEAPTCGFF